MKPAAIYARVSSNRKEEHTIASQSEAPRAFALQQGFRVPDEWVFEDEGYSGATLIRRKKSATWRQRDRLMPRYDCRI
jgi:site-specific DNA recombinase